VKKILCSILLVLLPLPSHAQIRHHECVFQDGHLYVYDIDNNFAQIDTFTIPTGGTGGGTRGSVA
jgi:hypothetical protein